MVGGSDAHTLKHVAKVYTVSRRHRCGSSSRTSALGCFAWGEEMRFRDLVSDIYILILAYYRETGTDLMSADYTSTDKTIQIVGRLAGIPTSISGLPAAITSLNYIKQIIVSKGIEIRFSRLVEQIGLQQPEDRR
jgi:hypothetical protein